MFTQLQTFFGGVYARIQNQGSQEQQNARAVRKGADVDAIIAGNTAQSLLVTLVKLGRNDPRSVQIARGALAKAPNPNRALESVKALYTSHKMGEVSKRKERVDLLEELQAVTNERETYTSDVGFITREKPVTFPNW